MKIKITDLSSDLSMPLIGSAVDVNMALTSADDENAVVIRKDGKYQWLATPTYEGDFILKEDKNATGQWFCHGEFDLSFFRNWHDVYHHHEAMNLLEQAIRKNGTMVKDMI